ncbi:MAG: DNA-formamidopyrimidine glycosylase, partial [Anaerolineae bacterium]
MPELPEVETLATDLQRLLVGTKFTGVEVLWPKSVAMPTAEELVRELPGREILDVARRGKFLVFSLSGPSFLLIHLRMSGQVRVGPALAPVDSHARVIFHLADGRQLLFSDPRKFGRIYWTTDPDCALGALGPEPLAEDFTAHDFVALLAAHKRALKPLLLDQTVLAGLGNIYTDEALFAAGLHPLRKAHTLSLAEGERLY